ncbi:MAG: hypothetical protein B6U75_03450 [Desulfurococcales archaeon ex4484_217_1]|nr:MAG: hypothetical protein B6U75_03450 [Desulfurococcales archaeon ex4484_217_1]
MMAESETTYPIFLTAKEMEVLKRTISGFMVLARVPDKEAKILNSITDKIVRTETYFGMKKYRILYYAVVLLKKYLKEIEDFPTKGELEMCLADLEGLLIRKLNKEGIEGIA